MKSFFLIVSFNFFYCLHLIEFYLHFFKVLSVICLFFESVLCQYDEEYQKWLSTYRKNTKRSLADATIRYCFIIHFHLKYLYIYKHT